MRESYNRISRAYRGDAVSRDQGYFRWLAMFTPLLHAGAPVLDLGCGCGIPVAQELARTVHDGTARGKPASGRARVIAAPRARPHVFTEHVR